MLKIQSRRRRLLQTGVGLGLAALVAAPSAWAQAAWPERPVRLVVPFPPGGLIDNMARLIAPRLSADLGQTVIVDNRPGAGGNVGAAEAARSPADGYTLLMASPPLSISPALYRSLPYQPGQIEAVAMLGRVPNVLMVGAGSGIDSVQALTERIKARPGQMNYASNGVGTSLHLSAERYKHQAGGLQIAHVPYRGAAAAQVALMAGEVDMMFDNLPSALGQLRAGKLKPLAVTTTVRSSVLPEVPTLAEAGLPDFDVSAWFGLAAPAGVPPAVVERLAASMAKLAADPAVVEAMARQGADLWHQDTAAARAFVAADTQRWQQIANVANIQLD